MRRLWTTVWRVPLWAIPTAIFFGTIFGSGWLSYWLAYLISLVFSAVIGVSIWWLESFILARRNVEAMAGWLIALHYFAVCLVASYGAALIVHLTLLPGFLGSARAVAVSGMFSLLFTALVGGIVTAIKYHRTALERARAIERLRAELAEAELRALRAQVHPHFLFNALNTIAALVREHADQAEDTIVQLAEVFRYTLRAAEREHARLDEELEFLRAYLAIERARFGARLKVEEQIEDGVGSISVPSLLLQPVIENAVRHGIGARAGGGTIVLTARREAERLLITIEDDGPGFRPTTTPSGNGFGLHSVRERLRGAGPPHDLAIETRPGGGTRVVITLPVLPSKPATPTQESRHES